MANSGGVEFTAEVHFAQRLASNEKKTRDKAMRKLKKWLDAKSAGDGFSESDYLKIWKGLHYSMWMQDKPIIQEELSDTIASLVHVLKNVSSTFLFLKVFFMTEAREWNGIDRWRLDKFMLMIRNVFSQFVAFLRIQNLSSEVISKFTEIVETCILLPRTTEVPDGFKIHIIDIYMDEIDKLTEQEVSSEKADMFLSPFYEVLMKSDNLTIIKRVESRIFQSIIDKYIETFTATDEEDDKEEEVTSLQFAYGSIADKLFEIASNKKCINRNRPIIYKLVTRFRDMEKGVLPVDDDISSGDEDAIDNQHLGSALNRLQNMESQIIQEKLNYKKKPKKNKLPVPIIDQLQEIDDCGKTRAKKHKLNQPSPVNNKKKLKKSAEVRKDKVSTKATHGADKSVAVNTPTKDTSPITNDNDRTAKCRKSKNKSSPESSNVNSALSAHDSALSNASLTSLKVKDFAVNSTGDHSDPTVKNDDLFSVKGPGKDIVSNSVSKMSKKMKKKLKKNHKAKIAKTICDVDNAIETVAQTADAVRNSRVGGVKHTDISKADIPIHKTDPAKHINSKVDKKETEIWVPNKKYKGNLKGLYEIAMSGTSDISPKKDDVERSFAKFDKLARTPPAFVRKAIQKVTPKTEPKKMRTKTLKAPGSAPPGNGKKHVLFNMERNRAVDFPDSINFSPEMPFSPGRKPDQGILKTPPSLKTVISRKRSNKESQFQKLEYQATPTGGKNATRLKKKVKMDRATAADFF